LRHLCCEYKECGPTRQEMLHNLEQWVNMWNKVKVYLRAA
jgi:hypothetical protein